MTITLTPEADVTRIVFGCGKQASVPTECSDRYTATMIEAQIVKHTVKRLPLGDKVLCEPCHEGDILVTR